MKYDRSIFRTSQSFPHTREGFRRAYSALQLEERIIYDHLDLFAQAYGSFSEQYCKIRDRMLSRWGVRTKAICSSEMYSAISIVRDDSSPVTKDNLGWAIRQYKRNLRHRQSV